MNSNPDQTLLDLTPLGWVFGFAIAFAGIIINSMAIFAFIKQRNYLKHHRIVPLLFYITIFELLDCVYGIPLQAFRFYFKAWPFSPKDDYSDWDESESTCAWSLAPFFIIFQMSVYLLLLVNVSRALSLYDQRRAAQWFNWKYSSVLVLMVRKENICTKLTSCYIFQIFTSLKSLVYSIGVVALPLLGIWGKIAYRQTSFSCDFMKEENGVVEPQSVMVGMVVVLNWIISLSIFIYTMLKLRKEVEERQIYLKNLQTKNFDIAEDRNAHYHQYIIESEVNANRTVKSMMIAFTIGFFPCK